MSWFEEWFDSPLYEKLYAYRNEEEAELLAGLIEKEIPLNKYPEILDLGCGRGRHSITLAQRGYHVTGIDLSEQAIRKARQIAENRNLDHVNFIKRDMREPLSQKFDSVLNLFTSFGYFSEDAENASVFDAVEKMLRKNGLFFVDYMNSQHVKNTLVPDEAGVYQEINYSIKRWIKNNMVFKKIIFDLNGESQSYTERVKLYDEKWFKNELLKRDFEI